MTSPQFLDRNAYLPQDSTSSRATAATRLSFYHHFADLAEFTDALVDDWERTVLRQLDLVGRPTDATARFEATAKHTLHEIPHAAEAGLRACVYANPVAAAALKRVDLARQRNYTGSVALFNDDPERREELGHPGLKLLI